MSANLLSESEYHRIHMLEKDEYAKLSAAMKNKYERTHEWHFEQRVGNTEQSVSGLLIDGVPPDEFEEYQRSMRSQVPNNPSASLSVDATGHEHKGKGQGGGQFTSGGSSEHDE